MARAALHLAAATSTRDLQEGLERAASVLGPGPVLVLYRSRTEGRTYELVARAGGPIGVPLLIPWGDWGPADRARKTGDPGTGGPHPYGDTQVAFIAGPASRPPGEGLGLALLLPPGQLALPPIQFLEVLSEAAEYGDSRCSQFSDLARRSLRDPLTGVLNRKALEEVLVREVKRASRPNSLKETSLLMIDLDGFKTINDRHGHQAGDRILREIAEAMGRVIRVEDVLARYGGDEFAIVLPETPARGAMRVAHKIRGIIACTNVRHGSHLLQVEASIGVATDKGEAATFDHAPTEEEKKTLARDFARRIRTLMAGADSALYAAKEAGRNAIRHASTDIDLTPTPQV